MAMIDEECMCRRKVFGFDVCKGVVEELVRVRRPVKLGDLEDKRDTVRGAAEVKENCCHRSFVLQSIHHRKWAE
jgi:hypothetical protein